MANTFNFTKANNETPNENGWCQMWAERGFGFKGLYPSAFAAYQAVPVKRGGTPPNGGNYYLIYFDGWFYGHRYGDVALYRNGKVWSGSNVNYRRGAGISLAAYKKWLGTPQLCWSEYLGSKKIATIPPPKPAPKPATGRIAQKGKFTANTNMKIRRAPDLTAKSWNDSGKSILKRGESVTYDSYIDFKQSSNTIYRFISYIGHSGRRNYIARRKIVNGKTVEEYGSAK